MKYLIDCTSPTASVNSIESALISAGIRTATLYKDANNLIFTTPRSNKVIRIYTNAGFIFYFGDAWTSGVTITNQQTFSQGLVAQTNAMMIVTPNAIHFTYTGANPTDIQTCFIATLDDSVVNSPANMPYLVGGFGTLGGSSYTKAQFWDTTNRLQLYPVNAPRMNFTDKNGNYVKSDCYLYYATTGYLAGKVVGGTWLSKGNDSSAVALTYGNDVVLPVGVYISDAAFTAITVSSSWYIPNGAI